MKKILLFIIPLILLTGCGVKGLKAEEDTRMYTQGEMIDYLNNLGYNIINKISVINSTDERITLRIKNTTLDFDVWQKYECVQGYSKMGLCDKRAYTINTNYLKKSEDYFVKNYQTNINYNNDYCYKTYDDTECSKTIYNLNQKDEVDGFVKYINNFVVYLNNQIDQGIITDFQLDYNITVYFDRDTYKVIYFDINRINNKYSIILNQYYNSKDLSTYINDYISKNNPFMEYNYD